MRVSLLLLDLAAGLVLVLALVLLVQILRQRRHPAASMAWVLFILFMPVLGIPLYLMIGRRKLHRVARRKARLFPHRPGPTETLVEIDGLLHSFGVPPALGGNRVRFHGHGEEAMAALEAAIEGARETIDLCTFIFADDAVGRALLQRLEAKARAGVRVRLLLDGAGSLRLPNRRLRPLIQAGGEVAWFMPVLARPGRAPANLRNHRKLVLTDGRRAWTGGRNLGAPYLTAGGWIDLSFTLEGPAVALYRQMFEADWAFATARTAPTEEVPPPAPGASRIRLLPSGPDVEDDPLHALLVTACFEARRRILVATPYYVPDDSLQEALCLAARRGLEVDLIVPRRTDHPLVDYARRRYLRELHTAGARVWLLPGPMMHAKALVWDRTLATCGSANLDVRSLFINFEANTLFYEDSEILWLERWLEGLRRHAAPCRLPPVGWWGETLEGLVLLTSFQL